MRSLSIGWLGTGRMGVPMAQRLQSAGCALRVWNRTPARTASLVGAGASLAASPAQLGQCDIVFAMLARHEQLTDVLCGSDGLLSDRTGNGCGDRLLVDCSSISAEQSRTTRTILAGAGVAMLAAPVSGNPAAVASGALSLICSGPRAAFDKCHPYLKILAPAGVTYAGDGELARAAKLCHNLLLGNLMQSLAEVCVLAEKSGLSRAALLKFLGTSVLGSPFLRYKSPALVSLDFSPTFTADLLLKDIDLGLHMARGLGVVPELSLLTRERVQAAIDQGYGDRDIASLLLTQAAVSGMTLREETGAPQGDWSAPAANSGGLPCS